MDPCRRAQFDPMPFKHDVAATHIILKFPEGLPPTEDPNQTS